MSVGEVNIELYCGDDWKTLYEIEETDLTGWSVIAQIREQANRTSLLIAEFSVNTDELTDGKFTLSLTAEQTLAITHKRGYYDIRLTDTTGLTETYISGEVVFRNIISV